MIKFAVVSFCLASVAWAASEQVQIDAGPVIGATQGEVTSWKGMPFAAPPIGENRWRAPQPVTPWTTARSATEYGADCMQKPFPGDAAPLGVTPKEDCLYLNVWAPAKRTKKLPVMVWIYGGGFVNGGSSPAVYDGSHFAESGVILVSFNYRLGRFGFFAFPAITRAASGSEPLGNYAFMDQLAALHWVKKNIAAFGGDPNDVTIFGESAGGMSVLTLLTTPLADGLFHRAIVESGGGRDLMGPPKDLDAGEKAGTAFAKEQGIEGSDAAALAALRALPAEKVVDDMNMMNSNVPTFAGPMVDGRLVPEPVQQVLLEKRQAKVPLIIGANSSEFGFAFAKTWDELMSPFGANRQKAEAAYDPEHKQDLRAASALMGPDRMFVEPARFVSREMRLDGEPSFEYRFSYVAESMRKEWKGAPHATEIPYVFDTVQARYGDKLTPHDEATAKAMHAYWVAFAKTGKPEPKSLPKWPVYDPQDDELMDFTAQGPHPEADAWKQRLDVQQAAAAK